MNEDRLYELALQQCSQGNVLTAIETLKKVLATTPDHAGAHAVLSSCLLDTKRIHAAKHEAKLALSLAPDSAFAHRVMASCLCAHRKFKQAEQHMQEALELAPEDPENYRYMAHVLDLQNSHTKRNEIRSYLNRALELEPNDPDTLAALGDDKLSAGELTEAEKFAKEALASTPEHIDSLVLMGNILLRQGKIEQAREHALWALHIDASYEKALYLMAAIKARENPFLGLWWRYATWMGQLGSGRAILVLIGAFILYRLIAFSLTDLGYADVANLFRLFWFLLCIYTWVGPGLFDKMVKREIETISLKNF